MTDSASRMPFKQRLLLSLPLPGAWMSHVIIHNVYVKFYTDVIGLSTEYVGWVYLFFNIWNVINDPVFGVILDRMRYRERQGKFLRVMRITVPFMLLGLVAMAWSDPSWGQRTLFFVLLAELFLFDVAATFYLISATSYFYLAAPRRADRIDVEVVRTWVANITSFGATIVATQLLVGNLIKERTLIATILMAVVVLNGAVYAVAVIKLKDPPHLYAKGNNDAKLSWPSLRADIVSVVRMRAFWAWFFYGLIALAPMGVYFTAFLYFMDHVIRADGWQATIADAGSMAVVLICLPLLAAMVKRVGSRTSIFIGALPYLAGFALLWGAGSWWAVGFCYVLIMVGKHVMTMAGVALEAALVDDNERLTGTRKTGLIASVKALLGAPVAGVQLVILTSIMRAYGYNGQAPVQTEEAIAGIRFAVAGIPILFCLAGLIPLLFLPYTKKVEAELSEYSRQRRSATDD